MFAKMNFIHSARCISSTNCKVICSGRYAPGIGVFSKRHTSNSNNAPKQTCLHNFHQSMNAKMELFAGYSMPIVYKGQTMKSEHLQTRKSASVFDVSHMMQTIIRGKDMIQFMEGIIVADVAGLGLNKCSLSVFTTEDGGIIDDCIIGKCSDRLQIVSNAANADAVWEWMNKFRVENPNLEVSLERLYNQGLIALQGPRAAAVLQQMTNIKLSDFKFMSTFETELKKVGRCNITRCGYTGEDGFEISASPDVSVTLMDILCNNEDVKPAGLGARDTLRLEAGLCLHGNDIDERTTPIEASLAWVVHKRRRRDGDFPGAAKILDQLKNGPKIKRIGLIAKHEGGPPARKGSEVFDEAGERLGTVTSGNLSLMLNRNIAMAYLPADILKQHERKFFCKLRGKVVEYHLTKMPFIKTNYYI